MKILILSVGTRVKVVEYFTKVKELEVICADASEYAPALYAGDTGYVIPRVNEPGYFEAVLAICERENVDGMLSLIDPEIAFLSKREAYFKKLGVTMIMPPKEEVWRCFDKREMYEYCVENQIQTIPTYSRLCDFEEAYLTGKIKFPVFVKPAQGSGSISIQQVNDFEELRQIDMEDMMIQTLMTAPEYGIDAYCDLLTGDVVEIFIKEKSRWLAAKPRRLVVRGSQKSKH